MRTRGIVIISLQKPTAASADSENRWSTAAGYLYLGATPRATLAFVTDMTRLALELSASAHLEETDQEWLRSLASRADRLTRHAEAMHRAVSGGAPELGKRP